MKYTPHTEQDVSDMHQTIGIQTTQDLFNEITPELKAQSFNIPEGKSEYEVYDEIQKMVEKNNTLINFLGGGYYDHYIPAVVDAIANRSEFYTPYTPYQPEVSQGTLQALFEYQSVICELTGMEVANASMYDGGTALAESMLMALRITKTKNKIIIDESVNPLYRSISKTTLENIDCKLIEVKHDTCSLHKEELIKKMDNKTAAIVVQNPNFFGTIDDYTDIAEKAHEKGVLVIQVAYPIALGLIKTPAEMDVDIVVGEGQCLGNYLSFGGPYVGIIATKKKYIRNMPGRIVGETEDKNEKKGYVLTLQAREQHIRRHKATSNICSNQNLCALRALLYLTSVGKRGLQEIAQRNYDNTEYTKEEIAKSNVIKIINTKPTFNEFVIELPKNANSVVKKLMKKGIAAGLPLGMFYKNMNNCMLITVTEKRTKDEIDTLIKVLEDAL
ncbi:aminomethyl-transferring glycine dehydrogenase subunit GcvPA [Candidatus Margulisiibacteriota bacterium]